MRRNRGHSGHSGAPNIPELAGLALGDRPERWEALGFAVRQAHVDLGAIRIALGAEGRGITGWAIRGIEDTEDIDGLPTATAGTGPTVPAGAGPGPTVLAGAGAGPTPDSPHPNGATGVDHVVVVTPNFDRTAAALARIGMPLRRIRDVGAPGEPAAFRQGFRRLGPAILELVEAKTVPPGPARFWGLVVIVDDLDALAERLGDRLGNIKPAVQPGRRIATLRGHAQLGQKLAFMDPEA